MTKSEWIGIIISAKWKESNSSLGGEENTRRYNARSGESSDIRKIKRSVNFDNNI